VKQFLSLVAALALLWILLSGHTEPLVLASGLLSIIFVSWLATRMMISDRESYPFALIPRLSGYWLWLFWEIVKSNVDTARRALGPKSAVKPVVFEVPASQRTDLGLVIHANSITLTPGTVTLECGQGFFKVHALHPDVAREALESGMDSRVPEYGDD
jgi:multicomponent Na+:H+ antiporter subunit E